MERERERVLIPLSETHLVSSGCRGATHADEHPVRDAPDGAIPDVSLVSVLARLHEYKR